MELVATLLWDQWQLWRGIDGNFRAEYADSKVPFEQIEDGLPVHTR